MAAARLGADVVMIGCVGDDENGKCLLASLTNAGVNTQYVRVKKDRASSCAYICVAQSGENAIIVDSSANNDVTEEYLLEHIE